MPSTSNARKPQGPDPTHGLTPIVREQQEREAQNGMSEDTSSDAGSP